MRESKFRAWDKNKNIMVYDGDLYHWRNLNKHELEERVYPCKVTNLGILFSNKLSKKQANDYVEVAKDGHAQTYYSNWESEQLYFETLELLQYTGLKDENGKKIYEGDIVIQDIGYDDNYLVVFREEFAQFCLKNLKNEPMMFESRYTDMFDGCCEVIGNIYENPELLEVKK